VTAYEVSIAAPGGALAYASTPAGAGPWPGVVVLHDLVGTSPDLRRHADWLAAAGYLAVAPDRFRGNRGPVCLQRMIRETVRRQGTTFVDIALPGAAGCRIAPTPPARSASSGSASAEASRWSPRTSRRTWVLGERHRWHAVRGYLHELGGDPGAAATAYSEAAGLATVVAERDHLIRQAARVRAGCNA